MDDHGDPLAPHADLKLDLRSEGAVWTPAREALWERIKQHDFEPDTPLNFARRLARDHGWSLAHARAAFEFYCCCFFLCVVSPTPVTLCDLVDEVWHQHLIYSRD